MLEAKFYSWIPFVTATLFKISMVKSCQGYYYQGYICTIHVCKQTSFFWQQPRNYTVLYPVPGITFCLKQVHHGKVVIQELSNQSQ